MELARATLNVGAGVAGLIQFSIAGLATAALRSPVSTQTGQSQAWPSPAAQRWGAGLLHLTEVSSTRNSPLGQISSVPPLWQARSSLSRPGWAVSQLSYVEKCCSSSAQRKPPMPAVSSATPPVFTRERAAQPQPLRLGVCLLKKKYPPNPPVPARSATHRLPMAAARSCVCVCGRGGNEGGGGGGGGGAHMRRS